jgi:ribonuclease-3
MLEEKLGYVFKDKSLLKNALIHKSYMQKSHKNENNERLEFLGDSVLGFTVAEYIYLNYAELPEGELTKIRSIVVCEDTLFRVAKSIGLGDKIYLGRGEEQSEGRNRPSILSDAMEAVFAAIFLDGGIDCAKKTIIFLLKEEIERAVKERDMKDYKTVLQEIIQKDRVSAPKYILLKEEGPDHNKTFTVSVNVGEKLLGTGVGRTKKEAEKMAAKEALNKLAN